jgi:acyl-CoA synthetase (AMP-forming)/AMP-acid ligase II/acyl carrier protein
MYGPTETTIWSTVNKLEDNEGPVLIGYPIANTQIYILDRHLQPVPVGVPGELYIGGDGLSRGYLDRPELTAERFIVNPFNDVSGSRIYKTGDLAKYLPDGNIEVLGRLDFQVKVRGFRIELGEIESQIKGLEAVSNCVVVLREDRPTDQRLAAYYVCKDGQTVSESEVRRQLQANLPEYMVPQHFEELSSIPLTPNGKVDRQALPKPQAAGASEQGYVAPRTEAEQEIAAVWQAVLNCERVGVNDDFFELGGHSLLATQVISRINKLFNIQLPLRRFFEAKTIEALAEVIDISLLNAQDLQKPGMELKSER